MVTQFSRKSFYHQLHVLNVGYETTMEGNDDYFQVPIIISERFPITIKKGCSNLMNDIICDEW